MPNLSVAQAAFSRESWTYSALLSEQALTNPAWGDLSGHFRLHITPSPAPTEPTASELQPTPAEAESKNKWAESSAVRGSLLQHALRNELQLQTNWQQLRLQQLVITRLHIIFTILNTISTVSYLPWRGRDVVSCNDPTQSRTSRSHSRGAPHFQTGLTNRTLYVQIWRDLQQHLD